MSQAVSKGISACLLLDWISVLRLLAKYVLPNPRHLILIILKAIDCNANTVLVLTTFVANSYCK